MSRKSEILTVYTQNSGFTVVELLVVVAIIAILTGATISSYSGYRQVQNVKTEFNNVETLIKEGRNYAITGTVDAGIAEVPQGGYGLYFNLASSDTVTFFIDTTAGGTTYDGSDTDIPENSITLANEVEILALTGTIGNDTYEIDEATIMYQAPRANTIINNNDATIYDTLSVVVGYTNEAGEIDSSLAKVITISNITGNIETADYQAS